MPAKGCRDKRDTSPIMPMERRRNNRRRSVSRPHTYARQYPAQNEHFGIHGVSKREKRNVNIPKIWQYEICIPKSRILVQGILR